MTIVMYDSISVDALKGVASTNSQAVAGYVDGHWPDYQAMVNAYPHDQHLSVAVNAAHDADCLDIELGDATPDQAPAWVHRQISRGVWRPVLYMNAATYPTVVGVMERAGIARTSVRIWTAHFTGVPHIEPGSDATQWTDHSHGHILDESLCLDSFFRVAPKPVPRGIAGFAGTLDLETGKWTVHGTPGNGVVLGGRDEWWNARISINRKTGAWRHTPLPAD